MKHPHHRGRRIRRQKGGAAIMFAIMLPVLIGLTALAVDLARIHLTKVELQNAADAASMAGARSLSDAGGTPYNWSAASAKALEVARRNVANGELIQAALIETGYWNIPNPSLGIHATAIPGDVPAVRATITISSSENSGPLGLSFAPIFGIDDTDVRASAIAVIAPPAGGTGLFPFVIGTAMLDHFWNKNDGTPVLDEHGDAPTIHLGSIYTFDGTKELSGQWTTFQSSQKNPDVPFMRDLIENGNSTRLGIDDLTYLQPGAKATLYREVPVGTDVAMFIVDDVDTNDFEPIKGIVAFHIDGYSQGGKYISGHFIDMAMFPNLDPGNGNGVDYGAYTPPILVQ